MNGFVFRLLSVLGLLMSSGVVKAQTWIPLDKQEGGKHVSTEVIKSDPTDYIVKVTIHGLTDNLITNENGQFHRISIGRDGYLSRIGEPSLPIFSQSIAIPFGAKLSATITDYQWSEIEIGKLYPAQKPLLETERAQKFDYERSVYNNDYTPTLLNIGQLMKWRDIQNTNVSVCPFKYYPQENRLAVMTQFVLRVSFTYNQDQRTSSFTNVEDPYCLFDNIPYTDVSLVQSQKKPKTVRSGSDDYYNYLIIVGDVPGGWNSEKLNEFQRWKAQKGFKTRVVSTNTTGTGSYNIKNYISSEYDKGVRYVLFIGDDNHIELKDYSTPWGNHVLSDYWYGCVRGDDIQADVAIGRFSVETYSDFCNIVDKTIKYERKYNSSNEVLLVAHFEDSSAPWSYQGCCEQIYGSHCCDLSFKKAYGACNATNADVLTIINNGAHIVNYRGHGSPVLWGKNYEDEEEPPIYTWNYSGEAFTTSEINNMNDETCAVFFSVACQTGRIAGDTCMLEVFTRSNHGAVAFIGATEDTAPDANNSYDKLLFDKLLNDQVYHLGDLNISAHIANYLTSSNLPSNDDYKDNLFCYICGGDPTLEIWTAEPQNMDVDWSINNGYITLKTDLPGDFYITIASMNGERIDSIACSSNTNTIPIPVDLDRFFITINKHDFFPHIIYYDSVENEIYNNVFDYDAYYTTTPLYIFSALPGLNDKVKVKKGNKLSIKNGSGGVEILENFECEKGAMFEIQ